MKYFPIVLLGSILFVGFIPNVTHAFDYRLEIGTPVYRWTEHFRNVTVRESGPMFTLGGYASGAPWRDMPAVTLRGDFELFLARVQYEGFSQTLTPPIIYTPLETRSSYVGFGYEGSIGRRIGSSRHGIEHFVGLGIRWWRRTIESTTDVLGYPEVYRTLYGRLGLRGNQPLTNRVIMQFAASIDPMLSAREDIDWSDITGEKITVRNGKRWGWMSEIGLTNGSVDGTLYWRATRFGQSNVVSGALQPKSTQDLFGVKVGFAF